MHIPIVIAYSATVHGHFDRTRGPRPKPLDLRRSVSNRNTPSTNSTESNNSPNSILSSDHHHHHHHSQVNDGLYLFFFGCFFWA